MTKDEAIKILESQKNEHYKEEINEALDMAISALKGGWTPIESKEKPKDYDRVLITINGCRGLIVREAQYHKAQNEFEVLHNHERWEVGEKGLLAWQPLPEPYKIRKENDIHGRFDKQKKPTRKDTHGKHEERLREQDGNS
jgi:hypothetical protein